MNIVLWKEKRKEKQSPITSQPCCNDWHRNYRNNNTKFNAQAENRLSSNVDRRHVETLEEHFGGGAAILTRVNRGLREQHRMLNASVVWKSNTEMRDKKTGCAHHAKTKIKTRASLFNAACKANTNKCKWREGRRWEVLVNQVASWRTQSSLKRFEIPVSALNSWRQTFAKKKNNNNTNERFQPNLRNERMCLHDSRYSARGDPINMSDRARHMLFNKVHVWKHRRMLRSELIWILKRSPQQK